MGERNLQTHWEVAYHQVANWQAKGKFKAVT